MQSTSNRNCGSSWVWENTPNAQRTLIAQSHTCLGHYCRSGLSNMYVQYVGLLQTKSYVESLYSITFGKGFLQSEVLGEVSVLEGGSLPRSFSRSLPRSFSRSFRPCFAGTFRAEKNFSKTSALNSHDPAQQNWRNFREKLHDEVLQGDPRQHYLHFCFLGSGPLPKHHPEISDQLLCLEIGNRPQAWRAELHCSRTQLALIFVSRVHVVL